MSGVWYVNIAHWARQLLTLARRSQASWNYSISTSAWQRTFCYCHIDGTWRRYRHPHRCRCAAIRILGVLRRARAATVWLHCKRVSHGEVSHQRDVGLGVEHALQIVHTILDTIEDRQSAASDSPDSLRATSNSETHPSRPCPCTGHRQRPWIIQFQDTQNVHGTRSTLKRRLVC